jgi:AraC-like DNA-binding protein
MRVAILADDVWPAALDGPGLRLTPSLAGSPRGRVRMGANWESRLKTLDVHLVYACRRGRISVWLAGAWQQFAAGEVCLIPPQTPFRFQSRTQPMLARFRLRVTRNGQDLALGHTARIVAMDATLERLVDLLVDELHADESTPLVQDLARAFCRAFARSVTARPTGHGSLTADQLAMLAANVARRPCGTTPRDLARQLGLGLDWASRLIRARTGLAPRAWLVRERIRLAAELLSQGLTPQATALRLGYGDARLFGRQFRSIHGCPPGAWQRRATRE